MAGADAAVVYTYVEVYLPRWNLLVPMARTGNTLYGSVPFFCEWLGVQTEGQKKILHATPRYQSSDSNEILREVPFKRGAGWRKHLALRKQECAIWLTSIESSRCRPEVRGRLDELKEDFLQACDKVLWDVAPGVPEGKRSGVSVIVQVKMVCQECGTPHLIVVENGVERVERLHRGE